MLKDVALSRHDGDYEKKSIGDVGCIFRDRGKGDFEALEDREVPEVSMHMGFPFLYHRILFSPVIHRYWESVYTLMSRT
jgi:hypothetical protein